jgi:hypothetical protein
VRAVNSYPKDHEGHAPDQEVILSDPVPESQEPLLVVQTANDEQEGSHVLVAWKLLVNLRRPRMRLQNPSIVFSASANLKAAESMEAEVTRDEYLPSQVPSGLNLLESFNSDPALSNYNPRLSALRVSRVAPATHFPREMVRPFKNLSRQTFKALPAMSARVRYSRPNGTPSNPLLMASVDIDITPFATCDILVQKVDLNIIGGSVKSLNDIQGLTLPISCHPRDDVTFLYQLSPGDQPVETTQKPLRTLEISIGATALVSDDCQAPMTMQWKTTVDFTVPLNPGYGQPSQAIQRARRPANLSIDSFDVIPSLGRRDSVQTIDLGSIHKRNLSVPDFGITITFTSAGKTPRTGGIFSWDVFVVNRSSKPRKLALLTLPRRRRNDISVNRPPLSPGRDVHVADAVMDENVIHVMQKGSAVEAADIVCLSTDVRIGPLAPSACHSVELKFMVLSARSRIIDLEAVRVIDLTTQEYVDVRDLPSIVL